MKHPISSLVKFSTSIIKYYANKTIGVDAYTQLIDGFSDLIGDEISEKIESFIDQNKKTDSIIEAFRLADEWFISEVDDPVLKQTIISKPFSNLDCLTVLASKVPENLDDKNLLRVIRGQFGIDWGNNISDTDLDKASLIYRDCLDRALAIKCGQMDQTIFRKIERIETTIAQSDSQTQQKLDILLDFKFGNTNTQIQLNRLPTPDSMPLQPSPYLPREKVVHKMLDDFETYNWLVIIDSQGKGKTQLAISIGTRISKQLKWISFRNQDSQTINHFRDQLALWLTQVTGDVNYWLQYLNGLPIKELAILLAKNVGNDNLLILDDLPDPKYSENLYIEIEIVARIFSSNNLKIISTSQRNLPDFLLNNLNSILLTRNCPLFVSEDVLELLKLSGAPVTFQKEGLVDWISASSKGHPILIASTILWLRISNWKYSSIIDGLISGEPIKESQDSYQRQLVDHLSGPEKELLYRLSIANDTFSEKQALGIANLSPGIQFPKDVLHNIIGPWIDKLENGGFDVNPLLSNSGKSNLEFEIQQSIHRFLAKEIVTDGVIGISKANILISHLWQAHDYLDFAQALFQLLRAAKTKKHAKYIDWATYVLLGIPWPDEINLDWRILIRSAQVYVSAKAGNDFHEINSDLDTLLSLANPNENFLGIITSYIMTGLANEELPLSITLPRSLALLQLASSSPSLFVGVHEWDLIENLPKAIWAQAIRAKSFDQILFFLEEVTKLRSDEMNLLLNSPFTLELSVLLLDQIWYVEASKPPKDQNWSIALSNIGEIENLPIVRDNFSIIFACARARSIIYADYFKELSNAISILDKINPNSDSEARFMINYAKGCYFSDAGFIENAILFFNNAENSSGESFKHYRLDNTRRLALERSKNNEWDLASDLLIQSIQKFRNSPDRNNYEWDAFDEFGEIAFIHWKNKNWKKACAALFGYVIGLVETQDNFDDSRYRESFIKAGHGLGWFLNIAQKGVPPLLTLEGVEYTPVKPGFFGIRNINIGNHIPSLGFSKQILLIQIAKLSNIFGLYKTSLIAFRKARQYVTASEGDEFYFFPFYPEMIYEELIFGEINKSSEYLNLYIKDMALGKHQNDIGNKEPLLSFQKLDFSLINDDDLQTSERYCLYTVIIPIFLGVVGLELNQYSKEESVKTLKNLFLQEKLVYKKEWENVIDFLTLMVSCDDDEIGVNFTAFGDKRIFEILWYLLRTNKTHLSLNEVFSRHLSAAIALLDYGSIATYLLVEIGRILHKFWSDIAKNQRYAIHAPDLYENAINQISPHLGGITIKEILINTSFALKVRISVEVRAKIEEIAKL